LDASKEMIKIIRKQYPQLSFYDADLLKLNTFPKKKYNAFWASSVLMHIPKRYWPKMINNIKTILKPGAIGYISVPKLRPRPRSKYDQRYFNYWKNAEFKKILTQNGFKILQRGSIKKSVWLWCMTQLPKK